MGSEGGAPSRIRIVRVAQDSSNDQVGKILGYKLDNSGCKERIIFKIMQILYLDDGAFMSSCY